tara:strand:- start:81 stop:338 length:258 start_codon:yes stop_codon:yes gene_type:complete
MSISNHYKHVSPHDYETTYTAMLQASTDELTARGYAKILEEDELKILARYHLEKFRNWMRPLMDPDAISSEITIQMPRVDLPAKK